MTGPDRANMSRRDMLKSTSVLAGTLAMASGTKTAQAQADAAPAVSLCLFSKMLTNRPFAELPAMLPKLGLDAIDLTCRPGGHIAPERAADDLPKAFELFKSAGISVPMITTGIVDAREDHAETIIRTAARLGIRHAKIGYYRYGDMTNIPNRLAEVKARLRDIAALCKQYGVKAGLHNHSGTYVGAALWDVWQLIKDLDPAAIGSYFDLGHATAEGAASGWEIGLNLLMSRISIIGVKDVAYLRDPVEGWRQRWAPLGEGMAHLPAAFKRFKQAGFTGPVTLHVEYTDFVSPVGSEADQHNLRFVARDVTYLRKSLKDAGLL